MKIKDSLCSHCPAKATSHQPELGFLCMNCLIDAVRMSLAVQRAQGIERPTLTISGRIGKEAQP